MIKSMSKFTVCQSQLWQFSIDWYQRKGVEQACLQLQQQGANVNLLLLLLYCQQQYCQLTVPQIEKLRLAVESHNQQYTQTVRQLRQQLKLESYVDQQSYRALLDAELELERLEQHLLVQCFSRFALQRQPSAVSNNLKLYAQLLSLDSQAELWLQQLIVN